MKYTLKFGGEMTVGPGHAELHRCRFREGSLVVLFTVMRMQEEEQMWELVHPASPAPSSVTRKC